MPRAQIPLAQRLIYILSKPAGAGCMQKVHRFSACKMNDALSRQHNQCNGPVNAHRVADIVWQTESASAHKCDDMNK